MSLKAKIEAVIYASEEPVTLAQLVGLFGHEAQDELDQLAAAQQILALDAEPSDPDVLNAELLEPSHEPVPVAEPQPEEASLPQSEEQGTDASADASAENSANPAEATTEDADRQAAREEKNRATRLRAHLRYLLDALIADYATSERGLEIREVAGGYRLATKPEYHDAVRGFVKSLKPPLKLSLQALETLAVVAYKQPVTAPEISEIRGVDSGGVLGSLMARKLITTAGRKQVIGRPILYKTTKDFLLRFGLKDLAELPSIEEFEKMAGEFADAEPLQEEMQMSTHEPDPPTDTPESITEANLAEEREAIEPQADGDPTDLEQIPVDGRISGPPPTYDDSEDPSAQEAAVQQDEKSQHPAD